MRAPIRSLNLTFAAFVTLATLAACGDRNELVLGPDNVLNPADPRYMELKYGDRPLPQFITRPGAPGTAASVVRGSSVGPTLSLGGLSLSTSGVVGEPEGWESNIGTIQRFGDDYSELRAIGFTFVFYGKPYTQLWLASNGHVSFNKRNLRWWASSIPDEDFAIAGPAYGDWSMNNRIGDPTANVYMNVLGTAPNRRLVLTWNRVRACCFVTNPPNSFQMQLFEGTNEIKFLYNGLTQVHNVMNVGITSGTGAFKKAATGAAILDLDGCLIKYTPSGNDYTEARDCSAQETNRAPAGSAGGPYTGVEGVAIQFTASGTDPDGNPVYFSWSFGDGSSATGAIVSHAYANDGSYTATVTISDGYLSSTATAQVTVANGVPAARFEVTPSVDEGGVIQLALRDANDPSPADFAAGLTFAFDCGEGQGFGPYAAAYEASCPAIDNGARTVRGRVSDRDGGFSEYAAVVTIRNVTPLVSPVAGARLRSGETFNLQGSFRDPGVIDRVWRQRIEWGDDASDERGIDDQSLPIGGSHTYLRARTYDLRVAVTDKDGATGWTTLQVVVERLAIDIDILPGTDENPVNLNSRGKLPVAVLSTPQLSASLVDVGSVRLGGTADSEDANPSVMHEYADVDGDGDVDLLLHFDRSKLVSSRELTAASTKLVLTATLTDGRDVQGEDVVRIVGRNSPSRTTIRTMFGM